MSGECQVNVKSQSELDIGGREPLVLLFETRGFLTSWPWSVSILLPTFPLFQEECYISYRKEVRALPTEKKHPEI